MDVVVLWTHNGIRVLQRRNVRFSPSNLNHTLKIRNARECDSGIYSCFGITGNGSVLAKQTITVNVLLGMNFYVESWLYAWQYTHMIVNLFKRLIYMYE